MSRLPQWLTVLTRRADVEQASPPSETTPPSSADDTPPFAALIATQERIVRDLAAAAVAQQAVLHGLYERSERGPATADAAPIDDVATDEPMEAAGVDLDARLFGTFEVQLAGHQLAPWQSKRAASLLKFLLLHLDRPVRREVLMDAFWPGSSPKSARNNLNVTVYQLRSVLRAADPEHTHVVYEAGTYRLDPALRCRTDLARYERAVALARRSARHGDSESALAGYRRARSLHAGRLLDGETSGEWFLDAQRRLHLEHCAVLEDLCGLLLERGHVSEAVTVGSELIETDPCREVGHQLLMRAFATLQQPHLVVEQFRRCESTMRCELAVDPAETTVELLHSLLSQR